MQQDLFLTSVILFFITYIVLFLVASILSKRITGKPITGENAILVVCAALTIGVSLPILQTKLNELSYRLNSLSPNNLIFGLVFAMVLVFGLLYWVWHNQQKTKIISSEQERAKVSALIILVAGIIAVLYISFFILR